MPDYEKAAELLIDKCDKLQERIQELKIENAKLNIILYHRENGLSHPDFNAEIEISKQAERIKELELAKTIGIQACDLLKERIEELEIDIENRRNYETYLQSSKHPVYSYAIWLNQ